MKILIVDDEPLARRRLCGQLGDLALGEVVGEADNGLSALEAVEALHPDVVLLDVRMPGMDGLEAARHMRRLPKPPVVIFTTAFDEHALAAFETQALDYLLKPIRTERLGDALQRATMLQIGREVLTDTPVLGRRQHVSALVGGQLRLMPISEVRYFEADQGYVSAVSATSRLLIEDPLRALETEFDGLFVRIHRRSLVAIAHVRRLEKDAEGNTWVVLDAPPERLLVSRRLLSQVRSNLRRS
jgi:two-component system, LytTR family, response regulator AlgR